MRLNLQAPAGSSIAAAACMLCIVGVPAMLSSHLADIGHGTVHADIILLSILLALLHKWSYSANSGCKYE